MASASRWASTAPNPDLPSDAELAKAMLDLVPSSKKKTSQVWAACYNMLHAKHMAAVSDSTHAYFWSNVLIFGCSSSCSAGVTGSAKFAAYIMVETLWLDSVQVLNLESSSSVSNYNIACLS